MIFSHYNGKTPSGGGGGGGTTTTKRKVIDYSNKVEIYNNFEWVEPNFEFIADSECYIVGSLFTYCPNDRDTPTINNCVNIKVNNNVVGLMRSTSNNVAISNQITVHLQQGDTLKIDITTPSCFIKGILNKYCLKEIQKVKYLL